jgi:hypothetical protein
MSVSLDVRRAAYEGGPLIAVDVDTNKFAPTATGTPPVKLMAFVCPPLRGITVNGSAMVALLKSLPMEVGL